MNEHEKRFATIEEMHKNALGCYRDSRQWKMFHENSLANTAYLLKRVKEAEGLLNETVVYIRGSSMHGANPLQLRIRSALEGIPVEELSDE